MDQKHYVLVHGACHGAWCWHKLKPRLESAGHKVTILDLAASGINRKAIQDLHGIVDYSEPLLEFLASLPSNEKVVLVGHSLGGLNVALAMEKFPEKVALGVFLTAFMPDIEHKPSYVIDEFIKRIPIDGWLDAQFSSSGSLTTVSFGPKFLSTKLYQLCSIEDLELAKVLVRPGLLFTEDLSKAKNFTKEGIWVSSSCLYCCQRGRRHNRGISAMYDPKWWCSRGAGDQGSRIIWLCFPSHNNFAHLSLKLEINMHKYNFAMSVFDTNLQD
ncbi:Salicylic acid-binding protein 2 [Quillaja saponaria]|uniref:Salicylic acid-binding protein 2 n=1 Tax=Quillaja saponaria TaxID=32244 RepID=A0AAD7P6U1_QUISA|nr:Salicylic acid-binding protein 2 [Quillaja saponaria]